MDKIAPTLILTIIGLSGIGNVSARAANAPMHAVAAARKPFWRRLIPLERLGLASA